MHVAICDDDIAHRKHFERLMKRESDARVALGSPLYIDSFGSEEALFHAPMQYGIFFLGISQSQTVPFELARKLRSYSVLVPIIVVKFEEFDYPETTDISDLYYISNPLKPAELHDMIDKAMDFRKSAPRLYEIHSLHDTYYLREDEMIYAIGNYVEYTLYLSNGQHFVCNHSLVEYYQMIENDPFFAFSGHDVVFNLRYVKELRFSSVILQNGTKFPMSFSEKGNIAKGLKLIQSKLIPK